ncbi:sensor histidine kinase [Chryseoglobus sp. 28M-23]|uniref:sensor histidine kinase n=1 Tax=Chryseoglobus sp. 28M-23 TaxID=2772253 RepID=UPI00174759F6|nr:sensor histidine kinase [Chryseoglobus sp. 28M-23]QOD93425.1 sensor histidine kinase [Chryseoglobus sp. 28M-23]
MTAARGWSTAVIATAVLLAILLVLGELPPWRFALALAVVGLLVTGWFVFGLRRADDPRGSLPLVAVTIVTVGLGVAVTPTLAFMQVLAYPIAWMFMPTFRRGVVANLLLALAVALGYLVSLGTAPDDLRQIAITVVLSLAFSMAMGFWIARIMTLGEERGRLLAELQGAQEQIAALHRDAGAAAEREHLARELHDTIAQDLTGLVMLAQRARREGAGAVETLALIEENARGVLAETRALVAAGASVETGETRVDVLSALRRIAERFQRETGITVTVQGPERLVLPRDLEVVVLRCAQEALANARKHARASRIEVGLVAGDGAVRVTVTDDGIGFDPADAPDGFGLPGMRDRLAIVGGSLTVTSAPGEGTRLTAEVRVQELAL